VHIVLAALESLDWSTPTRILRLDAQFRAAVLVDDTVSFSTQTLADGSTRTTVRVGQQLSAMIVVETSHVDSIGRVTAPPTWSTEVVARSTFAEVSTSRGTDELAIDPLLWSKLFPGLANSLALADAAALLATTRIVGMRCPGQWALFRRLSWSLGPAGDSQATDASPGTIQFEVAGVDPRFDLATLAIAAGERLIQAEVIVREPPPRQAGMDVVSARVAPDDFIGTRALVVGGSRGLGELAAKVLASGAAEVLLTYRTGADDAQRVVSHLGRSAKAIQFTVEAPTEESLRAIGEFAPTHLSYFATPVIARRPPATWHPPTYEQFANVYAVSLSRLLGSIDGAGTLCSVLFPSSTFLDDPPVGFDEYVAAKHAGEAVCRAWQRSHPEQRVVVERFPPLVTDQTAALLGSDALGNLDILIPALRRTKV
jgi:hypothetical protein